MAVKIKQIIAFTVACLLIISFSGRPSEVSSMDATFEDPEEGLEFFDIVTDSVSRGIYTVDLLNHTYPTDKIVSYVYAFYYYDPLSFLVTPSFRYTHTKNFATSLEFTNVFSRGEALDAILLYKTAVEKCVKGIHGDWPDEVKVLYVYDYMANHFVYDHDTMIIDAYGLVSQGKGVCQAFTLFAADVLNEIGIVNDLVVAPSINHIWNRVRLNGEWYNLDFTWSNLDVFGNCVHDYFLRSDTDGGVDTDFKTSHMSEVYDWSAVLYTDDNSEVDYYMSSNACWYDTDTTFAFANGYWYYLAGVKSGKVEFRRTSDFVKYETVASFTDYYLTPSGSHWSGYYGGIKTSGPNVFFTTAKNLYVYDTVTGDFRILYTYEGEPECCIYGLGDKGSSVDLIIRNYPPTGGSSYADNAVETVNFRIPSELLLTRALVAFSDRLEYYLDDETGSRLIFGISEGDSPEKMVSALGGEVLAADGGEFSEGSKLTTGSIFRMGELEYRISIPGDTDCNGKLDENDPVYLLESLLNPDYFDLYYGQDYDGNGSFDTDDAIYLKKSVTNSLGFPIGKK